MGNDSFPLYISVERVALFLLLMPPCILSFFYNRNELKISMVSHLKYASDEDFKQVGLSKPEIRRLRKFYEKYYPHGYLSKIKRLLQNPTNKRDDIGVSYIDWIFEFQLIYFMLFENCLDLLFYTEFKCSHINRNTEDDKLTEQIAK